jgi:DNA-binding response OmpR family regulator
VLYSRAYGHHISLADDEPDITTLVAYLLANEGHQVTIVVDRAEAIRPGDPDGTAVWLLVT